MHCHSLLLAVFGTARITCQRAQQECQSTSRALHISVPCASWIKTSPCNNAERAQTGLPSEHFWHLVCCVISGTCAAVICNIWGWHSETFVSVGSHPRAAPCHPASVPHSTKVHRSSHLQKCLIHWARKRGKCCNFSGLSSFPRVYAHGTAWEQLLYSWSSLRCPKVEHFLSIW